MFNILSHEVRNAGVLDLFAGTGVLGIEALSRGAKFAVFLDQFKGAISVIKQNIRSCKLEEKTKIIRWNIRYGLSCLKTGPFEFDLVFMDPPYNRGDIRPTIENLHKSGCLKVGSTIVIEHSSGEPISVDETDFSLIDQRRYGKTLVTFLGYMV
jgi:16S rRNA (guanine966-N2)-methyltransferase